MWHRLKTWGGHMPPVPPPPRFLRLWFLYKQPENITDQDIEEFEGLAHQWVAKYLTLYHTKEVTPYIHTIATMSCR